MIEGTVPFRMEPSKKQRCIMDATPNPTQVFGPKVSGSTYRVFTYEKGAITEGAAIGDFTLKGVGTSIPAIIVGEDGRGRELGVLPVGSPPLGDPCPYRLKGEVHPGDPQKRACPVCGVELGERVYQGVKPGDWRLAHPDKGNVRLRLMAAQVGQTKSGKPKLWAKDAATTDEAVIIVFRTQPGFRGGCGHYGDDNTWKCTGETTWGTSCGAKGNGFKPDTCPGCGGYTQATSLPFPGEKLAEGHVAQGAAGRMGGGEQIVALVPKDAVVQVHRSGRLYGSPASLYLVWDGEQVLVATREKREVVDVF
jgi:hypothetical protein